MTTTTNATTQRRTFTTTHTAHDGHGNAYQYTLNTTPTPCEIITNAEKLTAKVIKWPVMDRNHNDRNNATTCGVVGDMTLQALHRNIVAGRVIPNDTTAKIIDTLYNAHAAGFMLPAAAKQYKTDRHAADFDTLAADFGRMLHRNNAAHYFSAVKDTFYTTNDNERRLDYAATLNKYGVNPTQNADFVAHLKAALYRFFIREIIEFKITNDRDDVLTAYNRRDYIDGFCSTGSCMWTTGDDHVAEALAVYYTPYSGLKFSVGLLILRTHADHKMIGRAVTRHHTTRAKQYNRIYTDHVALFEAVANDHGFNADDRALYGARFPLITTSGRRVRFPYIDGHDDMRDVRIVNDNEDGQFLQTGGRTGDEIGRASNTSGFLGITAGHYSDHDDHDDDHNDEFLCEYCEEWHHISDGTHTAEGLVCDGCVEYNFAYCEDCDTYHHTDRTTYATVGEIRNSDTDDRTICDDCIDSYFTVPSDATGTYYALSDLR